MAFTPYLAFAGNCRDAFTRYQEIFGGELVLLPFSVEPGTETPADQADRVMHAALMTDDALLMGADDPSGNFDGTTSGMCCSVSLPSAEEAGRVFDRARRRRDGAGAVRRHLLLHRLRHVHRQLRDPVDGQHRRPEQPGARLHGVSSKRMRRLRLPLFSTLVMRNAPDSPVFDRWVPPHA